MPEQIVCHMMFTSSRLEATNLFHARVSALICMDLIVFLRDKGNLACARARKETRVSPSLAHLRSFSHPIFFSCACLLGLFYLFVPAHY